MNRREFVISVLAVIPALALPAAAAPASRGDVRSRLFKGRQLDKEPLVAYTSLHLAKHPEDADFEALAEKVLGARPDDDPDRMKQRILAAIRKDFEAGRTVNLDGWVLSLTEVRLWCLYLAVTP